MIRRPLATSLVVLGLAGLAAGCSTFDQNDVVASVGDAELSEDELAEMIPEATELITRGQEATAGDISRQVIQLWVQVQILDADITERGASVTQEDRDTAAEQVNQQIVPLSDPPSPLQELIIASQAAQGVWSTLPADDLDEAALRERYDLGPTESGIACTRHILVATEAEALDVLADLEGGADFAALAAERSTDPGSAASGGALPCSSTNEFRASYVAEYVDAALAAEIGVPTDPVATEFGYHVIVVPPFDEVADEVAAVAATPQAAFADLVAAADVTVDPSFGAWDPVQGVVPLG